jgi:protein arginine kinase
MGEPLGMDLGQINDLMLASQPAHLQRIYGHDLTPEQRDVARAELVRNRLTKKRTRRKSSGGTKE